MKPRCAGQTFLSAGFRNFPVPCPATGQSPEPADRKVCPTALLLLGLLLLLAAIVRCHAAESNAPADLTSGWKPFPFMFEVQHPYDLKISDRYWFDPTNNTHHFWVNFTDKPHAPPPNRTTARTEMRLQTYTNGEYMFDADVNISPGTFACIAQVFDAKHGPVRMIIAHPDGTVMLGHDLVKTNAIGHWWNLKMTNDTKTGGKIRIYADNVLIGTYDSRGPRDYYFKCGVYSRENSARSEAAFRNVRMWVKPNQ